MKYRFKFLLITVLLCLAIAHLGAEVEPTSKEEDTLPREFFNFGFPGISGGVYYTFEGAKLYTGGSLRFDLFYGLDRNRPNAPFTERGRWETYIDIGLFAAELPDRPDLLFRYLLGTNISFETPRVLNRDFLIPYIGFEAGGLYVEGVGLGFTASPILGLNIVSLPQFTFSLDSALVLSTVSFRELLGLRVQINCNFVF